MAFKFVIFSCLVAAARAAVLAEPVGVAPGVLQAVPAVQAVPARVEDYDAFPQYRFGYNVFDSLTGDIKSQIEERSGDLVQGQYSFMEADGSLRTVTYLADNDGFRADVRNSPVAAPAVVEPAVVAEPGVVAARLAAPAPLPVVAPRFPAFGAVPASLARYSYQPFGNFAAPFAFAAGAPAPPAPLAPVVAV